MKKTTFILLCFFGLAGIVLHGQAKAEFTDTPYPVAVKYLPPPPDSLSMAFAYDVHQYMYHKSLRETERGQQALTDVSYGGNAISQRMQDIFGLPPASVDYPTIRKWFVDEDKIYAKLQKKANSKEPPKKSKFQQRLEAAYKAQQEQQKQQYKKR